MKISKQSPLKKIRKQCLECCGNSFKSVRFCHSIDCFLWYLRFGKFPKTIIKAKGKEWEKLFDKEHFKIGAKFCPDIEVEEYEL
jgi:hypothetical protein